MGCSFTTMRPLTLYASNIGLFAHRKPSSEGDHFLLFFQCGVKPVWIELQHDCMHRGRVVMAFASNKASYNNGMVGLCNVWSARSTRSVSLCVEPLSVSRKGCQVASVPPRPRTPASATPCTL